MAKLENTLMAKTDALKTSGRPTPGNRSKTIMAWLRIAKSELGAARSSREKRLARAWIVRQRLILTPLRIAR